MRTTVILAVVASTDVENDCNRPK